MDTQTLVQSLGYSALITFKLGRFFEGAWSSMFNSTSRIERKPCTILILFEILEIITLSNFKTVSLDTHTTKTKIQNSFVLLLIKRSGKVKLACLVSGHFRFEQNCNSLFGVHFNNGSTAGVTMRTHVLIKFVASVFESEC